MVASSCLVQRLLATHWWDWCMRQLAAEPPGIYTCAGVLKGGDRIQETSRAIAHPLVSRAAPWSLVSGAKGPRAGVGSLVGGATSWHHWLQGLGCLEPCVGLLVGRPGPSWPRAGSGQPGSVPGLEMAGLYFSCDTSAYWWVELDERLEQAPRWAGLVPWGFWGWFQNALGRAGSQGLWLEGPCGLGSTACVLMRGAGFWALCWAELCQRRLWTWGS